MAIEINKTENSLIGLVNEKYIGSMKINQSDIP